MKLIDTHCHPQMPQYAADRKAVIQRAQAEDIGLFCIGVDLKSSKAAIELAREYTTVWATVGLHPNDNLDEIYDENAYRELVEESKVIAIGEVGLDYYRTPEPEQQKIQRARFEKQIALSLELDLPLVIHCREAHNDMLAMLKGTKTRGVVHSFTGTLNEALAYVEHGLYLGFNGIITFASQYDESVKQVPLDRILLETDAPYLTPEPYRGKRNEPVYVQQVAERLAQIRETTFETVAQTTTQNSKNLFRLPGIE